MYLCEVCPLSDCVTFVSSGVTFVLPLFCAGNEAGGVGQMQQHNTAQHAVAAADGQQDMDLLFDAPFALLLKQVWMEVWMEGQKDV